MSFNITMNNMLLRLHIYLLYKVHSLHNKESHSNLDITDI